jgi:small subunit ribosomal protein S4
MNEASGRRARAPIGRRPPVTDDEGALMGRYTGPVEKLSRREGVQLYLKGERVLNGKSAIERRPYPPGEHGRGRIRQSEYLLQLREKQRAKRFYGVRERQFRRYFDRASRSAGVSGDALLRLLEMRLDNVVYRLGLAATRAQARQFVVHGHVQVNGTRVDRPSYEVSAGDEVRIKPGSAVEPVVRAATDLGSLVPPWLLIDQEPLLGRVVRDPAPEEVDAPVQPKLIVEFYSK